EFGPALADRFKTLGFRADCGESHEYHRFVCHIAVRHGAEHNGQIVLDIVDRRGGEHSRNGRYGDDRNDGRKAIILDQSERSLSTWPAMPSAKSPSLF